MTLSHLLHGEVASAHTGAIRNDFYACVLPCCPSAELGPQSCVALGPRGLREMLVREFFVLVCSL